MSTVASLVLAQTPTVSTSSVSPNSQFIGESFATQACFSNSSATAGYQPVLRIRVPAGMTIPSANYVGAAVTPELVGTGPAASTIDPITGVAVSPALAAGERLYILRYPLGSVSSIQPPQCMTLNVAVPATAPIGTLQNISVTPIFAFGNSPLDLGPSAAIVGTPINVPVTPAVIRLTKRFLPPESETATGPDFPRQYELIIDVANTAPVSNIVLSDVLPASMQYLSHSVTAGSCPTTTSTPSTTSPGGTLSLNCGGITGTVTATDVRVLVNYFVPKCSTGANTASGACTGTPILDPTSGAATTVSNTGNLTGNFGATPLSATSTDTFTAESQTVRKSVAITTDSGPANVSPGDVLTYTIVGEISDYFQFNSLVLADTIGDGQTYVPGSFTLTYNNNTAAGAAQSSAPAPITDGGNVLIGAKTAAGTTPITINLSAEMIARLGDGVMRGRDSFGATRGAQAATYTITYRTTVDREYTGSVVGTKPLSAGDRIDNTVSASGRVGSTVGAGATVTDTSSTRLTVSGGSLAKSLAFVNNGVPPALVKPGDVVTYRLNFALPTGTYEDLKIDDFLPLPVLWATELTSQAASCPGAGGPAAGQWCLGSATTISAAAPNCRAPVILTTTSNTAGNRIRWDFPPCEPSPVPSNSVVEILFSVTVRNDPIADGLNLTNLAQANISDSFGTPITSTSIVQFKIAEPLLNLTKTIVQSSNATSGCPTAAPTLTTVGVATCDKTDAGDQITYRLRVENKGRAPAFSVVLKDDLALGAYAAANCVLGAVRDLGGTAVAASGSLFDATGLTITAGIPANTNGTLDNNEAILVDYTCTVPVTSTPRAGNKIDNIARISNYSNTAVGGANFATNLTVGGPNASTASVELKGFESLTKSLVWTSLASSTSEGNNAILNPGEQVQFRITVVLNEGTYTNFAITDNKSTIPALSACSTAANTTPAAVGASATTTACRLSANASIAGTTLTCAPTLGTTTCTVEMLSTPQAPAAGDTNTATLSATNQTTLTSQQSWTIDPPNPAVSKTITPPTGVDGGNNVVIRLRWDNGDTNNPMFQCRITDNLNLTGTNPITPTASPVPLFSAFALTVPSPLPAGYNCSMTGGDLTCVNTTTTLSDYSCSIAAGVATCTATDPNKPCAPTPAFADITATVNPGAITGTTYTNTVALTSFPLPQSQGSGTASNLTNTATLVLSAPAAPSKTIVSSSNPDTTGANLAVGETVVFDLSYTFPEGVTRAVTLNDVITAGGLANFRCVTAAQSTTGSFCGAQLRRVTTNATSASNPGSVNGAAAATAVNVAVTETLGTNTVSLALGDVTVVATGTSNAATYILRLEMQVQNTAANQNGVAITDQARVAYTNGAGTALTVNGATQTVTVREPKISLTKTVTPSSPQAGDTLTYRVVVKNDPARLTPAYDVVVCDVLPTQLGSFSAVTYAVSTVVGTASTATTPFTIAALSAGQCGAAPGAIGLRGVIDKLDPNEEVTLTFTAQVGALTPLGSTITNTSAAQASSLPAGLAGDAASTTGAGSTNERTGPSNDGDFNASAPATFTTTGLNIDKALVSSATIYAVGDTARYRLKVGVPRGVARNVRIEDFLPTGMRYTGNPVYTIPAGITAVPTSPTVATSTTAPQVSWSFTSLSAATAGDILIEFDAVVENVLTNQLATTLTNKAQVVSDNPAGGVFTAAAPTTPTITVGEPNLSLVKNITSSTANVEPGAVVTYEVLVSNANLAATTPAYRLTLADTLPALMGNASAYAVSVVAGSGPAACPSGACLSATSTALTAADVATTATGWSITNAGSGIDLYPGVQVKITFQAVISTTAPNTATIGGNAVEALYSSQKNPANADARTGTPGAGDDDVDTTLNNYRETVTSAGIKLQSNVAIAKSLVAPASGNVVIGSTVTYKIKIDLSQGTTENVSLTDVLPPDLTYLAHRSSAGAGCTAFANPARSGSGQTVTLNFGNVVCPANASLADDFIEIEIDAKVNNVLANQAGRTLTNGGSNAADTAAGTNTFVTTGPTGATSRVDVDTNGGVAGLQGVTITIAEPALTITKTANPTVQSVGDEVVFTLNIAHAAGCVVPAYDVVLTDTLPANLTFVSSTPAMTGTGPYSLAIPSLACGDTQTVLVRAKIAAGTPLPSTLTNSAALTWTSLSGANGAATDGRTGQDGTGALNDYTTSTTANVSVIDRRILDASKTVAIVPATDTANVGVLDPNEQIEYTIVIKNTDALITTTGTVFTDAIPPNTTFVAGSITSVDNLGASYGTPSFATNTVTVNIGDMAPATSALASRIVTIKFKVSINAGTASGTLIRNQGAVDSNQTVTEPTDQDGVDSNGDQPTDIYVGGPPPTAQPLYATKSVARVVDADATNSTTVGDTMEYTFTVQNTSAATVSAVTLTDTWPAGLTYVAGSAFPATVAVTAATRAVNWPIGNLAPGQTAIATIRVVVSNLAAVTPAGTYVNQGSVTGTSATGTPISTLTDGNSVPGDGNQPTTFVATPTGSAGTAALDVQKRWNLLIDANSNGVVNPGDTISYQIVVTNTGNAPANNVVVNDNPLPTQVSAIPASVATSVGVVTTATATAVAVNVGTLAPGQIATITFNALINAATGGQTAANQASTSASNVTGTVLSDDNGDPTDGRGPTLTPIFDGAPAGAFPTVTKSIVTTSESSSTGGNVLIGEVVTYAVTVTVPAGTSNNVSIVDTLPVGMSFVVGSATLTPVFTSALNSSVNPAAINGAASGAVVALPASAVVLGTSGANPTLTVPLGTIINSDDDADAETYTLTYKAVVQNVATNLAGVQLTNAGAVSFNNQLNQPVTLTPVTTTVTVTEPKLVVDKQSNVGSLLSSGGTVRYTFVVTNPTGAGNRATGFDVNVKDILPTPFTSYSVVSFNGAAAGATQVTGITNVGSGTTVEFNAAVFPPDGVLTIVIDAIATGPITSGSTINNTGNLTWTSLPGGSGTASATPGAAGSTTGERTGSGGGTPNTYATSDSNAIRVGTPSIVKSVVNPRTNYAIGEEVSYQLVVSYPPVNLANNKIVDSLPAGLVYVAGSLVVTPAANLTTTLSSAAVGAGGAVTFDLGAVSNPDTAVRTVTLTYKARVANILTNQSGTSLDNSAVLSYTDPASGSTHSAAAVAQTIRVGEPVISLTKTVVTAPVPLIAGSVVRYQVSVTNTGNTPAYEQTITDTLPTTLSGISNVVITPTFAAASPIYGASTAPTVPAANITATGFTSTSFQLNPADSVTIAFDVVVQNNIIPGQTITNAARSTFSSLSGTNANERDGSTTGSTQTDGLLNNYNTSGSVDLTAATSIVLAKTFAGTSGVTSTSTNYAIGETINYRLRISLAPGTYNAVVVDDILPAGLVYQSHTLTLGHGGITPANAAAITFAQTGQALKFTLGTVTNPANASTTDDFLDINVNAVVANVVGNQSLPAATNTRTNGATLTQTPASGLPVVGSTQSVTATLVEPNLVQTKTALPLAPSLGDEVTYTLRVAHTAASTATAFAVLVKDLLPTNLTYVAGSASITPDAVSVGQNLQWTIPSLALAPGFTEITYRARVATVATIGVALTNSATLGYQSLTGTPTATNNIRDGSQGSAGPLNDYVGSATAPVTPQLNTFLEAHKTVVIAVDGGVAGQLDPADTLEYTIVLTNTSPTVTATNVVFTDPIPANTTFVAGSLSSTQGTPNATTSPLSVAVGSMTPGQVVTVKFRVTVNAGTPAGTVIRNQGSVDSDQTAPEPTDADNNDGNGDQPTDIPVGPVAPLSALYATKDVARVIDAAPTAATNGAGDTMRYTIVLKNSGGVALANVGFVDQIPSGLTYVVASALPPTIGGGSLTEAGGIITLTGASLPAGASIIFTFDVTINPFAAASLDFTNQGTATSNQTQPTRTDSNGNPADGNQPTVFTAVGTPPAGPVLDVQKRATIVLDNNGSGTVNPGDRISYIITVKNTGGSDATNVRFTDPLPTTQLTYIGPVNLSQGIAITSGPNAVDANLGTLAPNATATISFIMEAKAGSGGQVASNQASVTSTEITTPVRSDNNGNGTDGVNPTLTPIEDPANPGSGTPAGLVKSIVTTSEVASAGNTVLIGEVVTYRVAVNLPAGVTRNASIVDTLPVGMSYVAGSATLTRSFDGAGITASGNPAGINTAATTVAVALNDAVHVVRSGQVLTVPLGDVTNSESDANAESYTLIYKALVENINSNNAGTALTNSASLTYTNALSQPAALAPQSTTLTVIEPALTTVKSVNTGTLLATGGTVTYTVVVSNLAAANRASAFDVLVRDTLPARVTAVSAVSCTGSSAGVVVTSTLGTLPTVGCDVSSFAVGEALTLTYTAVYSGSAPTALAVGDVLPNTASTSYTSLPGGNGTAGATTGAAGSTTGERTGSGTGPNDLTSSGRADIVIGEVTLNKRVLNPKAFYAIGEEVSYELLVSIPGNINAVSVLDTLGAGLGYVAGSLVVTPELGLSFTPTPPADFTVAGQALSLSLGAANVGAVPVVKTVTLTYKAKVQNIVGNWSGTSLGNSASVEYVNPGAPAVTIRTAPAVRTITIGEPVIALSKAIVSAPLPVDAGTVITYDVTVRNTGTTTGFETVVTDALPATLSGAVVSSITPSFANGSPAVPTVTVTATGWATNPFALNAGDSVVIRFTAVVGSNVQPSQSIVNAVSATSSSLLGAVPGERTATDGVPQTDRTLPNNYNASATAPAITATNPVTLTKSLLPSAATSYAIGETVTYRLTLALLEGTVPAVIIKDALPAGLSVVSATLSGGNTGTATGNAFAAPAVGATGVLTFNLGAVSNPGNGSTADDFLLIDVTAKVDNVIGNQAGTNLSNTATLDYNTATGPAPTVTTSPVVVTVKEPVVQLLKSASLAAVSLGDEVSFTLTLDHTAASSADAYNLVVTDTLPAGLSYSAGSASVAPSSVSGQVLTWNIGALTLATDQTSITFKARVALTAAIGAPLTNNATLSYQSTATGNTGRTGVDGVGGLNDYVSGASAPITPSDIRTLSASKTVALVVDADTSGGLTAGDTLEYTIVLTNRAATAQTNVVFTDAIPVNTSYVAASLTSTKGIANDALAPLSVAVGTMAPAEVVTVKFRVRVLASASPTTVISNQGSVDSDQIVPTRTDDPTKPGAFDPTDIVVNGLPSGNPTPKLTVLKSVALAADPVAPAGSVNVGDSVAFTITVENSGNVAQSAVVLTDAVPSAFVVTGTSSNASFVGNAVTANLGALPVGATAIVTIFAQATAAGDFVNQASVVSQQITAPTLSDGDTAVPGAQPTPVTVLQPSQAGTPALAVQKSVAIGIDGNLDGRLNPGETVRYVISVRNTGSALASNVVLSDQLPVGLTLVDVSTGQGAIISGTSNSIVVNVGTIAAGSVVEIIVNAAVPAGTTIGTRLTNTASATGTGIPAVTSPPASILVEALPDLLPPSGIKSGTDLGYPLIEWRQVWINSGNAVSLRLRVTDPLAADQEFVVGSLVCSVTGSSVASSCVYDAASRRVIVEAVAGADLGKTTEAAAANEIIITFRVRVATSSNASTFSNLATAQWDRNGNGNVDDEIFFGQVPVAAAATVTPAREVPTLQSALLLTLMIGLVLLAGRANARRGLVPLRAGRARRD